MSSAKIRDKILKDARDKAEKILKEAEEEVKRILAEAEKKAEEIKKEAVELAKREGQKEKERILSVEQIEIQNEVLAAKRKLIDRAFKEAEKRLFEENPGRRRKFILQILESVVQGDEEIAVDSSLGGEKWVEELNKEKGWKLKPLKDDIDTEGGVILRKGNVTVKITRTMLMELLKEELETEVARILFGE